MGVPLNSNSRRTLVRATGASISLLGLEVTQAIQSLNNDVPLIADKVTVVRLYFSAAGFGGAEKVQGELTVSATPGGPARYIASLNSISVSAVGRPDLATQRGDAAKSLNFVLPKDILVWPSLTIGVHRVFSAKRDLPVQGGAVITRALRKMPPLRIRAVGLRYTWTKPDGTNVDVTPEAFHFDHLRSYLSRAYPVGAIEWSQIVIQANPLFTPPFSSDVPKNQDDPVWLAKLNLVHNQLAALRAKDMESHLDARTHYYGLVSDASGQQFFRGAAKDIPATPDPSVVAVGPAGIPGPNVFPWDKGRSYGGWYGAHELGHTFGRAHPGFCGQDADDQSFPYAQGRIGDRAKGDMVGFDTGDARLGIDMTAMGNDVWHDIMTYCDNQWISSYTYENILDRLSEEDAKFAPTA